MAPLWGKNEILILAKVALILTTWHSEKIWISNTHSCTCVWYGLYLRSLLMMIITTQNLIYLEIKLHRNETWWFDSHYKTIVKRVIKLPIITNFEKNPHNFQLICAQLWKKWKKGRVLWDLEMAVLMRDFWLS